MKTSLSVSFTWNLIHKFFSQLNEWNEYSYIIYNDGKDIQFKSSSFDEIMEKLAEYPDAKAIDAWDNGEQISHLYL